MNTTPRKYTILGTSDEVTACDCCGRADLKSTVALEDEHGHVVYYGCVCAARAMKIPAADVRREVKRADDAARAAAQREAERRHRAEMARFRGWLATLPIVVRETWGPSIGDVDVFRTTEANGGFKAVQAAYRAWCATQPPIV